jgi:hypothetical protein
MEEDFNPLEIVFRIVHDKTEISFVVNRLAFSQTNPLPKILSPKDLKERAVKRRSSTQPRIVVRAKQSSSTLS